MATALPLEGRVALVTGANHGIGASTALALAERGAGVLATYLAGDASGTAEYDRRRAEDGSRVRTAIELMGRRCLVVEADLRDTDAPARLFQAAEEHLGPVSVLVHNASGWSKDSFAPDAADVAGRANSALTNETVQGQWEVDARAGALLMARFIHAHRARAAEWGRIVTLTSGTGGAFPGEVSYGAAKASLISYTLSAAAEMAADGVTANVIYPPVTDTGWITDEVRQFVANDHEHHHIAQPEEVAEVIAWLCAEAGRVVTGNVIRLR